MPLVKLSALALVVVCRTASAQVAEASQPTPATLESDEPAEQAPPANAVPAAAQITAPKTEMDAQPAPEPTADIADQDSAGGTESGCGRSTLGQRGGFRLGVCGYVALNVMHDSTQSFRQGLHNNMVARRGTYAGDHRQLQFTARDSRLTFEVATPEQAGIKPTGMVQFDFNGPMAAETTESDFYIAGTMRLRHAYLRLETPIVDVLAGQYHDLFAWGGAGFYPATLAFLGVTGQVYHRQPQLRVSKTVGGDALDLELAAAATRPVHKASGVPDGQAGLRVAFDGWHGASTQAYGQPAIVPLSLGVSGLIRQFSPPEFVERPAEPVNATGWGVAASAVIPVIPVDDAGERGNGLTLTGEFSMGTGIADMYTELTGGVLFPQLANDPNRPIPPLYPANIDSGIVTFDGSGQLRTVDWRGLVIGAQYYLPIAGGRVWLAAIYARMESDNVVELTPIPSRGFVYQKAEYIDASLFVALTDTVQTGVAFQTVEQTFGDGVKARNNRAELGMHLFF